MNSQIKGNAAITRSLAVGGATTVHGNTHLRGNVRVDGWLDAPNVKGPCKGLFKTAARLVEAYPEPRPGWWALVGNALPAAIYRSSGGEWVDSGSVGGTPALDLSDYDDEIEAICQQIGDITDDITEAQGRMDVLSDRIDNVPHPLEVDVTADADLVIADQNRTPIVSFADGHIRTALFDSSRQSVNPHLRLRYLHWNIGHFSQGASPTSAVTADTYEQEKMRYRQLFNSCGADIVGLCEFSQFFCGDITARSAILSQYPHCYVAPTQSGYIGLAIASAMELVDFTEFSVGNGYTAYECHLRGGGRLITLCEVHTPWQSEALCLAAHRTLVDRYAQTQQVVIAGDMNVVAGTEERIQAMWDQAGYQMANWGYLGSFDTRSHAERGVAAIDNIFVKGGAIVHTELITSPLSDHYPLLADLLL